MFATGWEDTKIKGFLERGISVSEVASVWLSGGAISVIDVVALGTDDCCIFFIILWETETPPAWKDMLKNNTMFRIVTLVMFLVILTVM